MRSRLAALAAGVVLSAGCNDPRLSIDLIFHRHGLEVVARAHAIADCESGHRPDAVSAGGGNHGVMQLNNVHADQFDRVTRQPWATGRYVAWWNVYYANWLYEQQGFRPWSCAR